MRLSTTAPAANPPVLLADVKADLPVIHSSDDDKLQGLLDAAIAHVSGRSGITGRQLGTQAYALELDAFPSGAITLPLPPLQSVSAITYLDAAGQPATLAPAAYAVDPASEPGQVEPITAWPRGTRVRVEFVAGHGTATPPALRAAILLMVRDLYNEDPGKSDATIDRLVFPLRILSP